jgi:Putative Actinobacterial Holin-X, holin superfamily III
MEPGSGFDRRDETALPDGASPGVGGLLDGARSLWRELHELVHDQVALAALETKLAGKSLVSMVVTGVIVAVLLVSAWLATMAVAVLWLINLNVVPSVALLLAVVANLALALILCDRIRRQSRNLQFARTVRGLRPLQSSLERSEN